MANNAYICRTRTDLGSGAFQVLDLKPNASQRSLIYEPNPQSGYLSPRLENDAVTGNVVAGFATKILKGLAAYLVDVVALDQAADPKDTFGLTAAIADATAALIVADLDAGSPVTAVTVAAHLVTTGTLTGTSLTAGNSVGSIGAVLKILGGGKYSLPLVPPTAIDGTIAFKGSANGMFDDATYQQYFATGALQISCGEGTLSVFSKTTFSYKETAGAALVVYDESGNVLT